MSDPVVVPIERSGGTVENEDTMDRARVDAFQANCGHASV